MAETGIFSKLLSDPYAMNMLLNGIGILGSKRQSQVDRYTGRQSDSFLQQAKSIAQAKRDEEQKRVNDSIIGSNRADAWKLLNEGYFPGSSANSSSLKTVTELGAKLKRGETLTPGELMAFQSARSYLSRETTFSDAQGNVHRMMPMNMEYLDGLLPVTPAATDPAATDPTAPLTNIRDGRTGAPNGTTQLPPLQLPPVPTQPPASAQPDPSIIAAATPAAVEAVRQNQAKIDTQMATTANEWLNEGGYAKTQANLEKLTAALGDLKSGKTTTGGWVAGFNTVFGDKITSFVDPDFMQTKETVQEVAQESLKLILGGQFGIREGEQLIARAYNPNLPNEQNEARIRRLMLKVAEAAEAKTKASQYMLKNGTMKGYEGKVPSLEEWTDPASIDAMFKDLDNVEDGVIYYDPLTDTWSDE